MIQIVLIFVNFFFKKSCGEGFSQVRIEPWTSDFKSNTLLSKPMLCVCENLDWHYGFTITLTISLA